MGGGGFTATPDNPVLERYIVAQSGKKRPKVCFIGTATGDADVYVAKFYAAFAKIGCQPTHLSFFTRTPDLKKLLLSQDVIYVGGGNTKSMLAVWDEWGIPTLLRQAWRKGIVLAGVSAGAICWFKMGVTDSWAGHLAALPCLGFLPGTCCPHFDSEAERRPTLHRLVASRELPAAVALDDGAAAHYVDGHLFRVVSAKPKALGYNVRHRGSLAIETPIPVTRLARTGRPLVAKPSRQIFRKVSR